MSNTACKTKFLNRDNNKKDSLYLIQKMCPDKKIM